MRYFLFFFHFFYFGFAQSYDPSIQDFLTEFHKSPQAAMEKLPPEIRNGQVIERGFIKEQNFDPERMEEKQKIRAEILRRSIWRLKPWTAMTEEDRPEILVDGTFVQLNIKELDRLGLSSRFLTHLHWSDTYWPTANGLIAARYTEPTFPHNKDWLANYTSYLNNPAHTVATDNLSPAEKYDLLMGDSAWTMTSYAWRQGKSIHDAIGRVPSWMGLCHGWSAANQMQSPVPYGSVTLMSPSGHAIKFFQSDVKALITMMWAKTELPTRFIGYRCEKRLPVTEPAASVIPSVLTPIRRACIFLCSTNWAFRIVDS